MSAVQLGRGAGVQVGECEADTMSGQFLDICIRRSGREGELERGEGGTFKEEGRPRPSIFIWEPQLLSHGLFSSSSAMSQAFSPRPVYPMLTSPQAQKQQGQRSWTETSEPMSQDPTCPSGQISQALHHSNEKLINPGAKPPPP